MSSAEANPDSIIRIADSRYGISRALTTNPARSLLRITRLSSTSVAKLLERCDGLVARHQAGDELDQPQHRHGVEEVDADHLLGTRGRRAELHDRDRAGVAGQDRPVGADVPVELAEDRDLHRLVLDHGLDDQIRSARSASSVVNASRASAASRAVLGELARR